MPMRQLVTAGVEKGLNGFFATQAISEKYLSKLKGKRVSVFLDIMHLGITLIFDDKILVLNSSETFLEAKQTVDANTCVIKTKLSVLSELSDTSQLTALIQRGDLELVGDISIAQQLSELLNSQSLDIEEALAHYTSDVLAHSVFKMLGKVHKTTSSILSSLATQGAELALEERPIAARKQGVEGVGQQINTLRDDVDRAAAKLRLLEKQNVADKASR